MAVVQSLAIGKSTKSAGNLTYKTVRGRCIASQRITQNKSNTFAQSAQRSIFGRSVQAMQLVIPWVNNFFEKSKYGSSRNNFMKLCKGRYLMGTLSGEVAEGIVPLVEGFLLGIERGADGNLENATAPYLSYGSLSCIVEENKQLSKYNLSTSPINVRQSLSTTYTMTTAPKIADVSILVYGFTKATTPAGSPFVPVFIKSPITDEGLSNLASNYGISVTVVKDDTNTFVQSMTIENAEEQPLSLSGSVFVAVPTFGGKVPTVTGLFGYSLQKVE